MKKTMFMIVLLTSQAILSNPTRKPHDPNYRKRHDYPQIETDNCCTDALCCLGWYFCCSSMQDCVKDVKQIPTTTATILRSIQPKIQKIE